VNRRGAVETDTDASETRSLFGIWEGVQRGPAYWLGGGRQRGGAILVQASMRNVGTWRSDEKGGAQGAGTPRVRWGCDSPALLDLRLMLIAANHPDRVAPSAARAQEVKRLAGGVRRPDAASSRSSSRLRSWRCTSAGPASSHPARTPSDRLLTATGDGRPSCSRRRRRPPSGSGRRPRARPLHCSAFHPTVSRARRPARSRGRVRRPACLRRRRR